MINLLPFSLREDISYARKNTGLMRWIIASLVALAGLIIIVAGGLFYIHQSIKSNTVNLEESKKALQTQKVDETQKRVEEISANTKLATQVLSREILFSKLIKQLGSALPASTALKSLMIDKTQGGIQLNAGASDFNAATQLQLNLQDPKNGIFEKADINSINCGEATTENAGLPCDVSLRALFSENNSYRFISPSGPNNTQGGQ